jgi:excisionase family DNA binding protein
MTERVKSGVQWMTAQECADEIGVSKMTIYRLIHNKTIPSARIGRSFRVNRQHWRKYLQEAIFADPALVEPIFRR